jgi:transcriptional regulator with XRE-family HTH domain
MRALYANTLENEMKVTELGKFLRKLRIDHGEVMKEMADRLGFTSAYLSAIELGKRSIPEGFSSKIIGMYGLDKTTSESLELLVAANSGEVHIDIVNANEDDQKLAVFFAKKFPELSEEQKLKIFNVIGD